MGQNPYPLGAKVIDNQSEFPDVIIVTPAPIM